MGLPVEHLLLGSQIESMTETELAAAASVTSVFARLAPAHKEKIIRALHSQGDVLGFMGDGINDAPALKAADVGISVDSAVDIAKESSDIILLEVTPGNGPGVLCGPDAIDQDLVLPQVRRMRAVANDRHSRLHATSSFDSRTTWLINNIRRGTQRIGRLPGPFETCRITRYAIG